MKSTSVLVLGVFPFYCGHVWCYLTFPFLHWVRTPINASEQLSFHYRLCYIPGVCNSLVSSQNGLNISVRGRFLQFPSPCHTSLCTSAWPRGTTTLRLRRIHSSGCLRTSRIIPPLPYLLFDSSHSPARKTLCRTITLCPKSPSVRGFVASLPVSLLFKYV